MSMKIIIIMVIAFVSFCHQEQSRTQIIQFFQGCRKQLIQWVGFQQTSQQLIQKCHLHQKQSQTLLRLYKQWTQMNLSFSHEHFDLLRKYLKDNPQFKKKLQCIIQSRTTQNQYFTQPKKYKHFGKFIKLHPSQGQFLFVQQQGMWPQKGKKLCHYFKSFFEYYYLNVLRPSQTISTTFLRALTVRSDIFQHQDIAYCVSLETHGNLAQNLQGLDINNIYIKIPQVMNAIKFIKFKKDCQTQDNLKIMRKIQERLKNVDMFKVMYHDYEPFVQVAAEKFGRTQIKLLARKIAHIFDNVKEYEKYKDEEM